MAKKRILALMAATMMLTSSMTAFASETTIDWGLNGGSTSVEGTNSVVEPVLEVELPGELAFAINPLRLDADGDTTTTDDDIQIVSNSYVIRNYSNVAVLITTETTATTPENSTIEFETAVPTTDEYDTNTKELVSGEGKRGVYLALELPTAAAAKEDDGTIKLTFSKLTWDTGLDSVSALPAQYLLGASDPTEVLFILDAPDTSEDAEFTATSVSGFSFSGAVDPTKTYAESDITVKTVFTMNAVTAAQKGGYTPGASGEDITTGLDTTVVALKPVSP